MANSLTGMVNKVLTKTADLANQVKATTSNSLAGKTAKDLTRVEVYDFLNNATPEEKAYYYGHHTNEKGEEVSNGIPQSYVDRYIPQTYAFWNAGNSTIGDYGIDDSNTDTWKRIQALYNSGDVNGAYDLINALADKGKFGGYYDDNGQYWGFAQGYLGGANSSYLPVVGGKILSNKGLDTTGTNIWLTPDGKALHADANGALTDMGDTWSRYGNNDIVRAGLKRLDDLDASTQAFIEQNGGRYPEAPDPVPNGNGGLIYSYGGNNGGGNNGGMPSNLLLTPDKAGTYTNLPDDPNNPATMTPYQQVLSQTGNSGGASGGTSGGASGGAHPTQQSTVSTQQYAAAPEAYDPNSNTIYQQYINGVLNGKAPEYAGDPYAEKRDAALEAYGTPWEGSPYQALRDEYTQKAAGMKWDYNPDTDPVWQALQKQYRREGQRATEDTLGRYAAMTGGMPSTAAVTAASQAGDYYAAQLSDRLPQVYQDAYNRYLQDYMNTLGLANTYAGYDDTEYSRWSDQQGKNWNLATMYDQLGQEDYGRFQDRLAQYYKDLGLLHDTAMEDIDLNTNYNDTQYKRILDALEQANYEREQAENKRRWDLNYGEDKRRWDADFAADEAKTAYQQGRDAVNDQLAMAKLGAQYGDYSGLSGMGIDTSSQNQPTYAYSSDGTTYDIGSYKGKAFIESAPAGMSMMGSDGSKWTKNADGSVTIEKNGKTYYYGDQVPGTTQQTPYKASPFDKGDTGDELTSEPPASPPPAEKPKPTKDNIGNPISSSTGLINVEGSLYNWADLLAAYAAGEVVAQYDPSSGKYTFRKAYRKESITDWNG